MKKNMGIMDRVLRIAAAIIIGGLLYVSHPGGGWAVVLGGAAIILLVTALAARCPMYSLFGGWFCTGRDKSCKKDINSSERKALREQLMDKTMKL